MSQKSIYAIALTERQALQIESQLTQAGFSNDEISALIPDKESILEFTHETHMKVDQGRMSGAATGGVLGGALGLLASFGALAAPGVGRLIAVGPLLASLSGVAGAAVVGMSGALVGLGVPVTAAKHYVNRIAAGNILISVNVETQEEVSLAREILEKTLAEDIAVTTCVEVKPTDVA